MALNAEPTLSGAPTEQNQTWNLSSLAHTELFLHEALLALASRTSSKKLFAWVPHAWFLLREDRADLLFHRALSRAGIKISAIIGGRTTLDYVMRYALPDRMYECSMELSLFEHQRSTMLFLADTELLMVQLDQRTTEAIEQIFSDYPTTSDIPPGLVRELRLGKASISVTRVVEPEEIAHYRSRFSRAWRR